ILISAENSKLFTLRIPSERAKVRALCQGKDGTVWAGTSHGLYQFRGEEWQKLGAESALPDADIQSVMEDRDGTLWLGVDGQSQFPPGLIGFRRSGELRFHLPAERASASSDLARAPDGRIWTAQTGQSVRAFALEQNEIHYVAPEIRVGSQSILFDRDGALWI